MVEERVIERAVHLKEWEIRALLAGRKRQLRLPVKPQPEVVDDDQWVDGEGRRSKGAPYRNYTWMGWRGRGFVTTIEGEDVFREILAEQCPLAQPGWRLWVQEAFALEASHESNRWQVR